MSKIGLKYDSENFEIYLRYVGDMSDICKRYEWDKYLIFLSYVWEISKLCFESFLTRYAWDITRYAQDMHLRYTWGLPDICLRYTWDVL